MTVDLIAQSQKGDNCAVLTLITNFNPLLKKYAYKLHYKDAYYDLLLDFIKLLIEIRLNSMRDTSEGILVSYLCKAIHSSYIKRLIALQKHQNFIPYSSLCDSELQYIDAKSATLDSYYKVELLGISDVLTESELAIIKKNYFMGYTVTETATSYGITKQAVSKTKKRALHKLAKWYGTH